MLSNVLQSLTRNLLDYLTGLPAPDNEYQRYVLFGQRPGHERGGSQWGKVQRGCYDSGSPIERRFRE